MNPAEEFQEHPEEILHRARVGLPLSPRERLLRLEHLRSCVTCRFLEEARVDVMAEAARPVPGGTSITALVAATMASFQPATTGDVHARVSEPVRPVHARRRFSGRTPAFAAALVCMVAGVALAARWIARPPVIRPSPPVAMVPSRAAIASPRAHAKAPALPTASPEPVSAPSVAEDAASLFTRATEARRDGRAEDARRAYERLWRDFPGTPEAQTGRVAYGRWLLDRGEARLASVAFADYLMAAPRGTLAAEAGVGLAEAFEALGDWSRARHAWQDVLANPAAAMHAKHAKTRVRALDALVRQGAPAEAP